MAWTQAWVRVTVLPLTSLATGSGLAIFSASSFSSERELHCSKYHMHCLRAGSKAGSFFAPGTRSSPHNPGATTRLRHGDCSALGNEIVKAPSHFDVFLPQFLLRGADCRVHVTENHDIVSEIHLSKSYYGMDQSHLVRMLLCLKN